MSAADPQPRDEIIDECSSAAHEIKSALDSMRYAAPEMQGLHLQRIADAADVILEVCGE